MTEAQKEPRKGHITTRDGRVVEVTFLPGDENQRPEYLRRLITSARKASDNAIKGLLEAGIPAVWGRDGKIIKHYPDGHEEIIGDL